MPVTLLLALQTLAEKKGKSFSALIVELLLESPHVVQLVRERPHAFQLGLLAEAAPEASWLREQK
jgi:hypothetical protein